MNEGPDLRGRISALEATCPQWLRSALYDLLGAMECTAARRGARRHRALLRTTLAPLALLVATLPALAPAPASASAPPSHSMLWLSYTPVSAAFARAAQWAAVGGACAAPPGAAAAAPLLERACAELRAGLSSMLQRNVSAAAPGGGGAPNIIVELTGPGLLPAWPPAPALEGFRISADAGGSVTVSAASAHGALYGAWRLLGLVQREAPALLVPGAVEPASAPNAPLRVWNLWDNLDGSVERGYAGTSVLYPLRGSDPSYVQRYTDYARLLSSIGLNAVVWDNVNACSAGNEQLLASANLALLAPLAAAFYSFGIHSLLTPCWSSPQTVGGLPTSDPRDPGVSAWWDAKLREVSETLGGGGGGSGGGDGAFRGLLFKGDTEGQPGPNDDNMTELAGANIFGAKLAPLGAVCVWRAFSHPPGGGDMPVDQALYQFERFAGFENATLPNVVLQIKNGPWDFQMREPVHALFGRLPHVSLLLELEVTPEYLGQNVHAIGLPWQWESYLQFDLGLQPGVGGGAPCAAAPSTLLGIVAGGPLCNPYSGVAGVSNFGSFANWTGHFLSSANTYGFGRQAWSPATPASAVVGEWAETVFAGSSAGATDAVVELLADSWPAYENVTTSLGYGFVCAGNHFDMDPAHRVDYSNATRDAIGYNRGAPGAYAESYNGAVADAFLALETCPEELLLAFHNVPFTRRLRSGMSVLEHIYASHAAGAAASQGFVEQWRQLQGRVALGALVTTETPTEADVFAAALTRLEQGAASAATFANVMAAYFRNLTL